MKKDYLKILLVLVLVVSGFFGFKNKDRFLKFNKENKDSVLETSTKRGIDSFNYNGRSGIDALTLLKEKTEVEQDKTGMVVSISGRKANNEKREFWSFYVNGVQANVGSADYITKNDDIIDWKIETY